DAGPSDHLQADSQLDHLARELRRGADHDRVVAVDDLLERRLGVDVDVEAAAEKLDAGLGDGLADEDAHQREGATEPKASSAAGAARPGSTSAPTAASASTRSSIVTHPIWPMRNRRETRSPWPPAIVIPCRSRSASLSSTASMPSGVRAPVRTAALSSSGE